MVEAVMFWNEPNNKSHWDFEIDPEWKQFSTMVRAAGQAVQRQNPRLTRVLGGISPIDDSSSVGCTISAFLTSLMWWPCTAFPWIGTTG